MNTAYSLHEFVAQVRQHHDRNATADSVRAKLKKTGSAYGVTPRRTTAGHWLFPGRDVFDALGIVPPAPPGVTLVRTRLECAGMELLEAHHAAETLLSDQPTGHTPRERLDSIAADACALELIVAAAGARFGSALIDEELTTAADWSSWNDLRRRLIHAIERATSPLGWRTE